MKSYDYNNKKLQMTDAEILSSYQQCKDPKAQIEILADLNATSPQHIREILISQGIDFRSLPRRSKKDTKIKESTTTQSVSTIKEQTSTVDTAILTFNDVKSYIQSLVKHRSDLQKQLDDIDMLLKDILSVLPDFMKGTNSNETIDSFKPTDTEQPVFNDPKLNKELGLPDHKYDLTV